jgi:hypothetical protein
MKHIIISLAFLSLFSCSKNDDVSYPYTEHGIVYMGIKTGLTISSSDQAFENGLNEIMQQFAASQPNSTTEFTVDGITYDITNLREVTGGIPNNIWDIFWEDLDEYGHSVGSCWGFINSHIPSKRGTGTAYFIYAIVTNEYDAEVSYIALQGTISPLKTRSISDANPMHFIVSGNYQNSIAKRSDVKQ